MEMGFKKNDLAETIRGERRNIEQQVWKHYKNKRSSHPHASSIADL